MEKERVKFCRFTRDKTIKLSNLFSFPHRQNSTGKKRLSSFTLTQKKNGRMKIHSDGPKREKVPNLDSPVWS